MTYVGQQPATTFDSGIQDRFTGLTTNTVTLNHEISAEEDILVVWNNIVQDKNSYSVGGTGNKTVTLGGTLVSGDVVTVYYLNKVMQSVNPTAGSVTSTTITDDIISGQTALGATPADTDELLVSDAGVLKRVDYSHIKGGDNKPILSVGLSSSQTMSDNTWTTIVFQTEILDADGIYNNSTGVATPTAGTYLMIFCANVSGSNSDTLEDAGVKFLIGGSVTTAEQTLNRNGSGQSANLVTSYVMAFDGSTTVACQAYNNVSSGTASVYGGTSPRFGGTFQMVKLIT